MIVKRLVVSLILHSFLLTINLSHAQSDIDFARALYRDGEYELSSLEIRRWLHGNQDNVFAPYATYLLALSYGRLGRYSEAVATLNELIDSIPVSRGGSSYDALLCESHLQLLNLHFRERRFRDFALAQERFDVSCIEADPRLAAGVQRMVVAIHVYDRNWDEALIALRSAHGIDQETTQLLEREITEIMLSKQKSPVLGGIYALVPGLGHLYAGMALAGLRSFFINAACIGISVFCFVMGVPVLGALFAVIEGVLYFSNIYGGVNAVIRRNTGFILERRDRIMKLLVIPPVDAITFREVLFGS